MICFEYESKVYMLKSSIMPVANGDVARDELLDFGTNRLN